MKIGFTIGKFAPLHKGHQLLIETALREMDKFYVIVYDTDLINIKVDNRAKWIKDLYPNVEILIANNSIITTTENTIKIDEKSSKSIIEKQNGYISVESSKNQYTKFIIKYIKN